MKDASEMWFDFFLPLLQEYENHADFDQDVYGRAYSDIKESVYELGGPHSFRCEFLWVQKRVRYFELIPTWEIERVHDDTIREFEKIVEFRNALVAEPYNVAAEGIYSEEHMQNMRENKNEIVQFLSNWVSGIDVVDDDEELHRKKLRTLTYDMSRKANEVTNWHFMMAFKQFDWKADHPHDFDSANFNYRNPTAKFARIQATREVRLGFKRQVWRELVKFNFHFWRRI